jgi:hypothetical protein
METFTNVDIKVGVVDDHVSFTEAFRDLLNKMDGIRCTLEAFSGE